MYKIMILVGVAFGYLFMGCNNSESPQLNNREMVQNNFENYLDSISDTKYVVGVIKPNQRTIVCDSKLYFSKYKNEDEFSINIKDIDKDIPSKSIVLPPSVELSVFDVYDNKYIFFIKPTTGEFCKLDIESENISQFDKVVFGEDIHVFEDKVIISRIDGFSIKEITEDSIYDIFDVSHMNKTGVNSDATFFKEMNSSFICFAGIGDSLTDGGGIQLYSLDDLSKPVWSINTENKGSSKIIINNDAVYVLTSSFNENKSDIFKISKENGEIISTISDKTKVLDFLLLDNAIVYRTMRKLVAVDINSSKLLWEISDVDFNHILSFKGKLFGLSEDESSENMVSVINYHDGSIIETFRLDGDVKILEDFCYYKGTLFK